MSWITITKETLYEAKIAIVIDLCDQLLLAGGQDARVTGLIQGVVNEIRNAVATCKTNQVDADTAKVPASLRDLAVDLIIARLKNALEMELTPDERDNVTERRRQLRDIAACNLVVDQPDNAVAPEVQGGNRIEVATKSERVATREQQDGLI